MVVVTVGLVNLTIGLVLLTLLDNGRLSTLAPSKVPFWLRKFLVDILVAPVMVGIFSAIGYLFGVASLYLYCGLFGLCNLAAAIIYDGAPEGFNVPLGTAAGVILAIGATLLVHFLRRYTVQKLDA